MNVEAVKQKLKKLKSEHRTLDETIKSIILKPIHDQLAAQRLKKRKLQLKDEILKLEAKIIPDITA